MKDPEALIEYGQQRSTRTPEKFGVLHQFQTWLETEIANSSRSADPEARDAIVDRQTAYAAWWAAKARTVGISHTALEKWQVEDLAPIDVDVWMLDHESNGPRQVRVAEENEIVVEQDEQFGFDVLQTFIASGRETDVVGQLDRSSPHPVPRLTTIVHHDARERRVQTMDAVEQALADLRTLEGFDQSRDAMNRWHRLGIEASFEADFRSDKPVVNGPREMPNLRFCREVDRSAPHPLQHR